MTTHQIKLNEVAYGSAPRIGEIVMIQLPRPRRAIWWDRIRLFRWDVPQTLLRRFRVTGTTAGSLWPEEIGL